MIYKNDISTLKSNIDTCVGQKIVVKGSLGRNRLFEKQGTIEGTYPNIFVVKFEENDRKVTYSYTDILTKAVEVEVFDGNTFSPLLLRKPEELASKDMIAEEE